MEIRDVCVNYLVNSEWPAEAACEIMPDDAENNNCLRLDTGQPGNFSKK